MIFTFIEIWQSILFASYIVVKMENMPLLKLITNKDIKKTISDSLFVPSEVF